MVYRPTARVLAVLELLQSRQRITGAELAQRLEVDQRTVRHYIETLQDLGIPVEAERGRYGAYQLRPGFKLPPLIFTEEESLALTISLLMSRRLGLATTDSAFESVLAKIERILPEKTRTRVQSLEQTIVVKNQTFNSAPTTASVAILSAAVQGEYSVHLVYQPARGEITERLFDPYGIVYHEGFWYTIGYCHLRDGQRLFRLDRLAKVAESTSSFSRPQNFDALAAVQQALANVPNEWQIEVWLEMKMHEVQRELRLSKAHFSESGTGVLMRGQVEDLLWLARFLAGLGKPFIIHQPPELRVVVRDYAAQLANFAASTPQSSLT